MSEKMNKKQYAELVKRETPNSKLGLDCLKAFLVGGIICTIGEALMTLYTDVLGFSEKSASILECTTLIAAASLLTALDIYPKIAKFGGAGTLVPITGFSNAVTSPALEAKTEGYVLGVGAKIFTIAGPVILFGTVASVVAGAFIYFSM